MQGKDEAEILAFVQERYGPATAKKLVNIGRGGGNNKKGADFESYYAVAKICTLAAETSGDWEAIHVTCQEVAFVDDVCVRDQTSLGKTNYQAKNSAGAAASWDEEMEGRFRMQQEIDLNLHQARSATQVLLVSDSDKAAANDEKIPPEMKDYCVSEHFPHCTSSTQLLLAHQPLRKALSQLCDTDELSRLDTAFKVVLGEWGGDNHQGRSIQDVLLKAKEAAKPNLFAGIQDSRAAGQRVGIVMARYLVPAWLSQLLKAFKLAPAAVESGAFVIQSGGMSVRLGVGVNEPERSQLDALHSSGDVFLFLMSLEATQLVEHLPIGER